MLLKLTKPFLLLFFLIIASCVNNITEHGFQFADKDLEKIKLQQSKLIVTELLGAPTLKLDLDGYENYYYIKYSLAKKALKRSKINKQKIIKISFLEGRVSKIEEYNDNMQNNVIFALSKTKGERRKQNIFLEILNNLGKFGGKDEF
jgi:outer membrane protein assembly factor BamE (lipoprotein component of BamABCDE complex)